MDNQHTHVHISTGTILRGLLLVLFFVFLYILKDVIIIFLFAIIIASAMTPFANWLDSKGFPRLLGVLILYLALFGIIIFVLSLVVPYIADEISQLSTTLPKVVERVSTSLENVQQGSPQYFDFVSEVQNILDTFSIYLQQSSQSVISIVVSVFGGVMSFVAVVIIAFYLSVMKRGIESFIESVMPASHEAYIMDLWKRSEMKVGRWIQGQLLLALIVGLTVYIGLSLMGIKYALVLGILAMMFEIVPIVGPVLAAIPAVFLAFLQDPGLGLWVLVFYIVMQQLENHLLVPVVLGKTTGLNPVVVIMALLIGNQMAGIPGMILSVPIATVIVEILEDLAKHKEEAKHNGLTPAA
ncbi:MAG: AI-2E family transporter [Candidatus Taylorbacteria bacterium]|nr:AI-2E family transporter [Candidatus Taylorbacteria bacterium]